MSGITEILIIILIIVLIFFLPRLSSRKSEKDKNTASVPLTGRMRLAIFASIFWPILAALYFQPWDKAWGPFFYAGIGPVALLWAIGWIISGFKKYRQ